MARFTWDADPKVCECINQTERLTDEVDNVVSPWLPWLPDLQFLQADASRMTSTTNEPLGVELHLSLKRKQCSFTEKRRYSLRVMCRMPLHWFPLDVQHCPIQIQSFTYTRQFLTVSWDNNFLDYYGAVLPAFRVNPGIQYLQYDVGYEVFQNGNIPWYWNQVAPGEPNDSIKFEIIFYRRFAYQFVSTYIPSTAVVIAAFSALFISVEMSVERMNLAVITLVSLYTQIARFRVSLPSTPYFTACDVYLYACLICVVATIMVCALVERLHKEDIKLEKLLLDDPAPRKSARSLSEKRSRKTRKASYLVRQSSLDSIQNYHALADLRSRFDWFLNVPENTRRNERVNIVCRRVLISLYLLFLFVYFIYIFTKRPR